MGLLDSKRVFRTNLTDLAGVLDDFKYHFEAKGYTVTAEKTYSGGFISMTQGGLFRTVSGLKTGLNITLSVMPGMIDVSMEVGIFGKQVIPTAITALVFWPMIIPQMIGIITQYQLDEEAYRVIGEAVRKYEDGSVRVDIPTDGLYCPFCGKNLPPESQFCPGCGKAVVTEKTCPKCGAKVDGDSIFCNKCGAKFE